MINPFHNHNQYFHPCERFSPAVWGFPDIMSKLVLVFYHTVQLYFINVGEPAVGEAVTNIVGEAVGISERNGVGNSEGTVVGGIVGKPVGADDEGNKVRVRGHGSERRSKL